MVDSIVLALMSYSFIQGWFKGLLRALISPISLLLSFLAALLYYINTPNIAMAITISLVGSFFLNIMFSFSLNIWQRTVCANKPISIESRIFGGGLSIIWSGIRILMVIILITIVPINIPWLTKIKEDIHTSKTYSLVDGLIKHLTPEKPMELQNIPLILQSQEGQEKIQSLDEYKAVIEDETLREILSDKEIIAAAQNKDFSKLMTNPKMQTIFRNKELLKKILDLNLKIMEQK